MTRKVSRAPLFLYLFGFVLVGMSGYALAEKTVWEFHKSITGAFDVRFPSKYRIKSIPLRIDDKTVLFRSEIIATVGEDKDPYQKVFVVKVDQSMANRLKSKEIKKLLEVDAYKYKKGAQNAGGVMVSNDPVETEGFKGREVYITYGDGENKQGVRVKIMYTDITRVEMVLTGPASSMYAFKSNDFFESLKLYDGPGKIDGTPGENWVDYESPLGLFTLKLPSEENTFTRGAPKFVHEGKKEKGRFVFVDPILGYKSFFNFYGYKIDEDMTFDKVKPLLLAQHIAPFASNVREEDLKIETHTAEDGSYGTLTTLVRMRPLEKYPYINTMMVQAIFNNHAIVVLEYLGSHSHLELPLGKTVFSLVKFHPEKFSEERSANAGDSQGEKSLDEEEPEDDEATTLKANIKLGEDEEDSEDQGDNETSEEDKAPSEAPSSADTPKTDSHTQAVKDAPAPAADPAPQDPKTAVTPAPAPAPQAPEAAVTPESTSSADPVQQAAPPPAADETRVPMPAQ